MKYTLCFTLLFFTTLTCVQAAQIRVQTYPVYGQSAWQLRGQLQRNGAMATEGGGWAQTKVSQHYNASWAMRYGRCFMSNFKLTMHLTQILPLWANKKQAPHCIQKNWDAMHRNLKAHENKHLQAYLLMEKQIRAAIKGLPPQPNCMMMQSAVENTWHTITDKTARWHHSFDAQTAHGQREGVFLADCRS